MSELAHISHISVSEPHFHTDLFKPVRIYFSVTMATIVRQKKTSFSGLKSSYSDMSSEVAPPPKQSRVWLWIAGFYDRLFITVNLFVG